MSGLHGADITALRDLAARFEAAASSLSGIRGAVSSAVGSAPWRGGDADAFRGAWSAELAPRVVLAAQVLADGAARLRANADDQERTSTDHGGGPGGGAGGGGAGGGGAGGGGPLAMAFPGGPVPFGPGGPVPADPADPADPSDPSDPADTADPADPGDAPGVAGGAPYVVGPPTRPELEWDEDFVYDSDDPEIGDYAAYAEWKAKAEATRVHPGLQDAGEFYRHYLSDSGEPMTFDYERAYADDEGIRANVDAEIARTRQGVEELVAAGTGTSFSVTGDPSGTSTYPQTENWQKTIGGYQQWSSADVQVDGDQVTMTITVHAEDYYNFNRGQADIASGTPDDVNGRFAEVGWAKPFESSGTVERTVTWTLGDPGSVVVEGEPEGR